MRNANTTPSSTGVASRTKLPPSPGNLSRGIRDMEIDPLDLNLSFENEIASRLISIARYGSFQPQVLACSPLVPEMYAEVDTKQRGACSLGAVAGSHGIALFRVSRPHVPLIVLSHGSASARNSSAFRSMSFQPNFSQSLYLAAAKLSGVLVWDVSGHSLNPLRGRLEVDNGIDMDSKITSITWSSTSGTAPLLAATTASSVCLWDLRESSTSSFFKPSLRFGVSRKVKNGVVNSAPYVKVACSTSGECAIMDSAGMLRVFDTRMTDREQMADGALSSFHAFQHTGVGLEYLPSSKGGTRWVSWGVDKPATGAVVKVWKRSIKEQDESDEGHTIVDGAPEQDQGHWDSVYNCIGTCSMPYLACARICPDPIDDSFVTIGLNPEKSQGLPGWRADLWKVNKNQVGEGLKRIVSFKQDADTVQGLSSMLGKQASLDKLSAAEIAFSPTSSDFTIKGNHATAKDGEGKSEMEMEIHYSMVICSLSVKGYVATNSIPDQIGENIQKTLNIMFPTVRRSHFSFPTKGVKTLLKPEEKESVLRDAAKLWGDGDTAQPDPDSARDVAISDGSTMPFDMEVSLSDAHASAKDSLLSQTGESVSNDEEITLSDHNKSIASFVIDSDRIPCPRLCGASFGAGVGGLVCFNNGDVRKLWNWYARSDTMRLSSAGREPNSSRIADAINGSFDDACARQYPRSLQDLTNMSNAAKEAQWGANDNQSSNSSMSSAMGDNVFKENSDSVSDEGSDESHGEPQELHKSTSGPLQHQEEAVIQAESIAIDASEDQLLDKKSEAESSSKTTGPSSDMLCLGSDESHGEPQELHNSNSGPLQHQEAAVIHAEIIDVDASEDQLLDKKSEAESSSKITGPSSEMLSPSVRLSFAFDKLSLNNQSPTFAKHWKLLPCDPSYEKESGSIGTVDIPNHFSESPTDSRSILLLSEPFSTRRGLPRYRFLVPSPQGLNVPRNKSESESKHVYIPTATSKGTDQSEEERAVHSGEYSSRPSVQESMVFLKKLFNHQQEGGNSFSLMSPPDSPMLPNSLPVAPRRQTKSVLHGPKDQSSWMSEGIGLGVQTLRIVPRLNASQQEELINIKTTCIHNAAISRKFNESGKADSWELLSGVIDHQLLASGNSYDGWSGPGGGALGEGMVSSLFRYYESLGDVQMLATMVCVLRGSVHLRAEESQFYLLPRNRNENYNAYIRRYADLLYAWGMLNTRADINKHLLFDRLSVEYSSEFPTGVFGIEEKSPGIALVFTCPHCGKETDSSSGFCHSCQDFAFRCIICDNAVRGLFILCELCGHGGHVNHLAQWFSNHNECPSGCGCQCTFSVPLLDELAPDDPGRIIRGEEVVGSSVLAT